MSDLTLYQLPNRSWGSPNLSPFCMKLECYLRMAEVPYQVARMQVGKAPKGKIPYVVRPDGTRVGDSKLIIEELERGLTASGKRALDAGLAPREAAIGHLAQRTLDEAFYFAAVYVRWLTDDGYAAIRDEMKKFLPGVAVSIFRRGIRKKLVGQGTGKHTLDEVTALGAADFDAIAELLGDQPYLLGAQPRTVDCSLFAFLETMLGFPADSALKARLTAHPNLVAYRQRVLDRWWQDLRTA